MSKTAETNGGVSTALYTCPNCETTYISSDMQSCPECGGSVDQIPSESDLGLR